MPLSTISVLLFFTILTSFSMYPAFNISASLVNCDAFTWLAITFTYYIKMITSFWLIHWWKRVNKYGNKQGCTYIAYPKKIWAIFLNTILITIWSIVLSPNQQLNKSLQLTKYVVQSNQPQSNWSVVLLLKCSTHWKQNCSCFSNCSIISGRKIHTLGITRIA